MLKHFMRISCEQAFGRGGELGIFSQRACWQGNFFILTDAPHPGPLSPMYFDLFTLLLKQISTNVKISIEYRRSKFEIRIPMHSSNITGDKNNKYSTVIDSSSALNLATENKNVIITIKTWTTIDLSGTE